MKIIPMMLRCDLLEKSYLCGINNNLRTHEQCSVGCDLLEKSYLCGINNNGSILCGSKTSL